MYIKRSHLLPITHGLINFERHGLTAHQRLGTRVPTHGTPCAEYVSLPLLLVISVVNVRICESRPCSVMNVKGPYYLRYRFIEIRFHPRFFVTNGVNREGKAIGSVCLSVCEFHSLFWTDWPLNLSFLCVRIKNIVCPRLTVKIKGQRSMSSCHSDNYDNCNKTALTRTP